jgi:hypothetical protein
MRRHSNSVDSHDTVELFDTAAAPSASDGSP